MNHLCARKYCRRPRPPPPWPVMSACGGLAALAGLPAHTLYYKASRAPPLWIYFILRLSPSLPPSPPSLSLPLPLAYVPCCGFGHVQMSCLIIFLCVLYVRDAGGRGGAGGGRRSVDRQTERWPQTDERPEEGRKRVKRKKGNKRKESKSNGEEGRKRMKRGRRK